MVRSTGHTPYRALHGRYRPGQQGSTPKVAVCTGLTASVKPSREKPASISPYSYSRRSSPRPKAPNMEIISPRPAPGFRRPTDQAHHRFSRRIMASLRLVPVCAHGNPCALRSLKEADVGRAGTLLHRADHHQPPLIPLPGFSSNEVTGSPFRVTELQRAQTR